VKTKLLEFWSTIWGFVTKYISIPYLLATPQGFIFQWIMVPISTVLIISGIVVKFLIPRWKRHLKEKIYKKYVNYYFKWALTIGFFGLAFAFFSYEGTSYFGYRFTLFFWGLTFIAWVAYSLLITRKKMIDELQKHKKKKEKEKWMKK